MIDNFPAIFNFTSYFSNLTGSFVNNCAPVLPDHRARLPCSSVKGGIRRTKYLRVDFQFSLRVRWLVITAEGAGPWLIYWGLVADSPNLIITAHLHRHAKKPNYFPSQPCISKAQHLSSNFRGSGVSLEYIYAASSTVSGEIFEAWSVKILVFYSPTRLHIVIFQIFSFIYQRYIPNIPLEWLLIFPEVLNYFNQFFLKLNQFVCN